VRIVLQRVKSASVAVEGEKISEIGPGLLLLVGVASGDGEAEADWLAKKVSGLRVISDDEGKMNRSVVEAGGEVLAVSQFTLLGTPGRAAARALSGPRRPTSRSRSSTCSARSCAGPASARS
jgi:D-tyrosyl-tRNA(Tyr) deacylase